MSYDLFLDDERFPVLPRQWIIVRSFAEACDYVLAHGCPAFMSLDHDLGEEKTGYDFVKWFCEMHIQKKICIPFDFRYYVHSQNPIGKKNIESYLESFLRVKHNQELGEI